jgi:LTXXQ motif family protein
MRHRHWHSRHHGGGWGFSAEDRGCGRREAEDDGGPRRAEFFFSMGRDDDFGAFRLGVRRPLRYLASRLELSDEQVGAVARILERLKIERAQAEVEQRRTASAFADAVSAETFDRAAAEVAADHRATAGKSVQAAVAAALGDLHAALEPDQRRALAMLIRTRAITF